MPELEEYGAQPPIELLRQWMDHHGWYEHKKDNVDFKEIQDIMGSPCIRRPLPLPAGVKWWLRCCCWLPGEEIY